jgi:prepilin signal peptidase PulO-like enzyme (type II secretory pathway)
MLVGALGNRLMKRKLQEAGVPDAMGWGDVKWMALAGTFLGVDSVLSAILIGCFAGAIVGVLLRVLARVRHKESPIGVPFGPFLSLGILAELVEPGLAFTLLTGLARASAPA